MAFVPPGKEFILPRPEDRERTEQWEAEKFANRPWITASKIRDGAIMASRITDIGNGIEVTTHSDPTRMFVGPPHPNYRDCSYCRRVHDQQSCPGCGAPLRNER